MKDRGKTQNRPPSSSPVFPRLHGEAYCPKQIEKKAICLDGDVFETLNEIRGGKI